MSGTLMDPLAVMIVSRSRDAFAVENVG